MTMTNEDSWVRNRPDRTRGTAPIWTREVEISRHPGPRSSVCEYRLRILGAPEPSPGEVVP
jgi:hypothetical protein